VGDVVGCVDAVGFECGGGRTERGWGWCGDVGREKSEGDGWEWEWEGGGES